MTAAPVAAAGLRRDPLAWLFPATPAAALGVARMLFFGWLFAYYLTGDLAARAALPAAIRQPVGLWGVLPFPSPAAAMALEWAWKTSLLTAALGLLTRPSLIVSLISGFATLSLLHSFGKVNHSDAGVLLTIGLLCFARCGDAVSLDSLFRRPTPPAVESRRREGAYGWPFRAVWVLTSVIFLAAGLAKLRAGLWPWLTGWALQSHLIRTAQSHDQVLPLGSFLAEHRWLCAPLGAGTVAIELGFPLALASRAARAVLVPSMLVAQAGIFLTMGDDFRQFMALYVFWVPPAALLLLAGRHGSRTSAAPAAEASG